MTLEEFNDLQYHENIESMHKRTDFELSGQIKNPGIWEKI